MQPHDYIVIGAGSAGCALADRRSRDGRHSVLVVEAGGVELPFGGSRRSGFGRKKSLEGLDAYLRTKAITARL